MTVDRISDSRADTSRAWRSLRIAQVAPLSLAIPPRRYGGTERVIHALTEALVNRGHEVTLFAAGNSLTSAHLRPGTARPLWGLSTTVQFAHQVAQTEEVVRHSDEFDIIHAHVDYLVPMARLRLDAPVVTTQHGSLRLPAARSLLANHRSPRISISDAQRTPVADLGLDWVATVYNGLRLRETYQLGSGDGGYLVFLGRISPEKDPGTAIRVAIRAGIPIKIAARVDPADMAFHKREVVRYLGHPLVEWLGQVDDRGKARLLERALALILPIKWDEPFGLVFIEALAAGTPVIGEPRGSLPEIMRHGEHGFLCSTEDSMVDACRLVASLSREGCRRWALERFSAEQMASNYEDAYLKVIVRETVLTAGAMESPGARPTVIDQPAYEPVPAGS